MKKLDEKGFAISAILYTMLILTVLLMFLIVGILANRRSTLNKMSSKVGDDVSKKTYARIDYEYTNCSEYNGVFSESGSYLCMLSPGTYQIETWGAQGGYRTDATKGGKGGYSTGIITIAETTKIYVNVGGEGGHGANGCGQTVCPGGFNGGGYRYKYYGGGGASDVRINSNSLYARVIVAGGGGSDGATNKMGMYGGGTAGGNATESYGTGGYGGTASGNTWKKDLSTTTATVTNDAYAGFGFGGNGVYQNSGYAGAGGGGWYGGAGSVPDSSGDDDRGGGGGSGYVYTSSTASSYPTGKLLSNQYYLKAAETVAGNQAFPSPSGGTETGHSGDGYVKIKLLDASTFSVYDSPGSYDLVLAPGTYAIQTWGAQGGGKQNNSSLDSSIGGLGGYSEGKLTLTESTHIYINVGGMGKSIGSGLAKGGFNGGGDAYGSSTSEPGNGGGGASDVRIGSNSLYARVIVAGGGGGAGEDANDRPGYGGGTSGGSSGGMSTLATQTSTGTGGVFGLGANTSYDGGAGGGGWYGGGTSGGTQDAITTNSGLDTSGGAGGSGYVYTSSTAASYPTGCLLTSKYYLTGAQTLAGNSKFESPNGGEETGHSGDGAVIIMKLK